VDGEIRRNRSVLAGWDYRPGREADTLLPMVTCQVSLLNRSGHGMAGSPRLAAIRKMACSEDAHGSSPLCRACRAASAGLPALHARAHLAYVADTTRQAQETLQASMPGWLAAAGAAARIDGTPGPARDPAAYLRQLMAIHPVGDPDLCVRRLNDAVARTGIRHILLTAEGAGDPAATVENITRLGTQVLPRLQR
jgi:hypothetical protein